MLNHWGHTPGHLLILLYFHFQGRNLTWGRPVRKSRPRRSPLPSCSSRPSGRWRMSSMSLRWSSSSSSGRTPSERRTGSCTCWRKTSSTRRSTPKTREWECSVLAQREKRRYDRGDGGIEDRKRSCGTIWLWRSDQPGEATAFSPAALTPPTPFHFHFKGLLHRSAVKTDRPNSLWRRPLLHSDSEGQFLFFGWLCTVCVWLYFNSLLLLSFCM